jgi:hypothetical protein
MKRLLLLLLLAAAMVGMLALLLRWLNAKAGAGGRTPEQPAARALWPLFLLPLPAAMAALVALVRGQLGLLLGDALGYGLLLAGALVARRGFGDGGLRLSAGVLRRLSSSTGVGAVLMALGSGLTAWLGAGHHPGIALAFALVTLLGFYFSFGLEFPVELGRPRRLGAHGAASLREAERAIDAIERARAGIQQPELERRLTDIAALARRLLQRVGEDPRNLWRARRFLNVYLDGVQRVVEGYAKTQGQVAAPELDQRFRHALETVEAAFREQHQVLLERDVEDLDVQIEVLTRQLEREGIL